MAVCQAPRLFSKLLTPCFGGSLGGAGVSGSPIKQSAGSASRLVATPVSSSGGAVVALNQVRSHGGLADEDRIFTNIYGRHDWRLKVKWQLNIRTLSFGVLEEKVEIKE